MKHITKLSITVISCIFFNFCNSEHRKAANHDTNSRIHRTRDIGTDSMEVFIYQEFKDFEKDLGLNKIEYSEDSIQFRIWLAKGTDAKKYVWECKLKNGKWAGNRIVYENYDSAERVSAKIVQKEKFIPRMSWQLFFQDFLNLDIENKQSSLKLGLDGTNMAVEISKGSRYTFFIDGVGDSELADKLFELMKRNLEFH